MSRPLKAGGVTSAFKGRLFIVTIHLETKRTNFLAKWRLPRSCVAEAPPSRSVLFVKGNQIFETAKHLANNQLAVNILYDMSVSLVHKSLSCRYSVVMSLGDYFLCFLLNRSECVPVLSMTRISSWSCCSQMRSQSG